MKKKYIAIMLSAFLVVNSLCLNVFAAEKPSPPSLRREIAKITEGDWLNISTEQKLQDIDYLYNTLIENYPYVNVLERMIGADLNEKYKEAREKISKGVSDIEFYNCLDEFINSNMQIGHITLYNPYYYEDSLEAYKSIADYYRYDSRLQAIYNALNNKKSSENYKKMKEIIKPAYDTVMEYVKNAEKQQNNNEEETTKTENVTTKIIEPSKIAYIKIDSFPSIESYKDDKEILFNFYNEVKDYENVIFDITDNGGGSMSYFNDLIVAPNIDEPISADVYTLMKDGEYNRRFLETKYYESVSEHAELSELPRMNLDDLNDLDLCSKGTYEVNPYTGEKLLKGKLWLLVSKNVFSSSEYAAMFSKATGFMTLVGTETGGDGIGSDPLPIVLPYSGLIVRYAPIYGVTPDGASSQEFGTMPDIVISEGETALERCLKEINK